MIAKPFYLLKKIIITTKFTTNLKKKSLLQTTKVKNLFFYSYPYSNNLISFKTALLQTNLKQPHKTTKVKNPFFYHYPY